MTTLLSLLGFIAFIALIVGLINPNAVLLWISKEDRNRKKVLLYFGLSFLILSIISAVITPKPEIVLEEGVTVTPVTEEDVAIEPTTDVEEAEPVENEPAVEEVEVTKEEPTETLGQQQAVKSAESYIQFTAFSKSGLIGQLEYEGYDNADAVYAVDKLNLDWKEQAAKSAKSYLEYSSFSKTSLIEQLEYEGYSTEEATHGAESVGY